MKSEIVSPVVVKRLPRYYRYLGELLKQNITRVSSKALAEKMGVTASQIRQDLNCFGGFGQQGYGYNVEILYNEIGEILGLNKGYKAIIVGAGHLGHALASHPGFAKRGFSTIGIFDIDKNVIGTSVADLKVLDYADILPFIKVSSVNSGEKKLKISYLELGSSCHALPPKFVERPPLNFAGA